MHVRTRRVTKMLDYGSGALLQGAVPECGVRFWPEQPTCWRKVLADTADLTLPQPIPHPGFSHDETRISRVVGQFLAQMADDDAQVVAVFGMGWAPDILE